MPDPTPPAAAPAIPPVTPPEPAPAVPAPVPVPAVTPAPPATPNYPELTTITPPEFKGKSWVTEVKDVPALFKRVEFLQTKIGERPAGIPQDTAPKEEWDKFYGALGRPDTPDGYSFGAVPEGLKVDENFQKEIKGVMHTAGVNSKQAKVLEEGYNTLLLKSAQGQKAASDKLDADFTKMTDTVFGEKKDASLKLAQALIAKHTPESAKPYIANLSNEALVVLAATLNGVATTHIKPDQLPTGGAAVGPQSDQQKREEGQKLMASKAYTDPFDPAHETTVKRVNELYGTA